MAVVLIALVLIAVYVIGAELIRMTCRHQLATPLVRQPEAVAVEAEE